MFNIITRRDFIERSVRAALGAAFAAASNIPIFLQQAVADGTLTAGNKKLLFIFLRGGNDGLNTLIPWGDTSYNTTTRPTLYIPSPDPASMVPGKAPGSPDLTRVIDLGNNFAGLHPSLKDLVPIYNDGQLALIHRVGYTLQSRSHFDSQRYWENGMPRQDYTNSGLFYRAIVDSGLYLGRKFPAVSVQGSSPLSLRGPVSIPNLSDSTRYDLLGVADNGADKQKLLAAISDANAIPYPEKDNRDLLFATGKGLRESIEALKSVGITNNAFFDTDGATHLFPINAPSNQKGFSAASYGFFNDLKSAAQILASTDAVVAGTQLDGFDTHNNQGTLVQGHAKLLEWLGWGFYAVRQYMRSVDPAIWNNTVIVTLSEFGRTSKENGSNGTDHAEASVMFVAGGGIKGGVYQCGPDTWKGGPGGAMFQVNGRYLGRTVDYRSVLGELLRKQLGVTQTQLETVIPGYADPKECLLAGGLCVDRFRTVGELGLM